MVRASDRICTGTVVPYQAASIWATDAMSVPDWLPGGMYGLYHGGHEVSSPVESPRRGTVGGRTLPTRFLPLYHAERT